MLGLNDVITDTRHYIVQTPEVIIREIDTNIDHNHCTTRQFQHMTFQHEGVWFVFYSDGKDFRYQTSDDDGRTWRGGLMIDERPGVSYPDGVQSPDGTIYLIYDYARQADRTILMATFTERDVLETRLFSNRTLSVPMTTP